MSRLTRRQWMQAMGGGAAAVWMSRLAADTTPSTPPNILFILADDLGYGDLGCYGQARIRTPHIDRLAAEGIRFTQCYAGSTVCAPSRCSLMTGMHTGHSRIRGNDLIPLEAGDKTIAECLHEAGYDTGLIGKWGLGEPDTSGIPTRKGFDEFYGFLNQKHAHNHYPEYLWRNETKEALPGNKEDPDHPGVSIERKTYANDRFTEEAISFLDRHHTRPFFLYLAYTAPHANNERGALLKDGMETPDYGIYADESWPNPQKGHAAMITRMDEGIGRVLDQLQRLGIAENTLVFFSSDNGTHHEGGAKPEFFKSSGPLRGIKRDLYEGGIRVPMIVRWPEKITAARTSDQVWAFWDFLPTAAELAGAAVPACDGVSIASVLCEGKTISHPPLYWEFHEGGHSRALRDGDWKLVKAHADTPAELYNLADDPAEAHNIAADHPDILSRMEQILLKAGSGA